MIIENTDALYSWLMSCLGRLCDADPAALAKYVMALVKKDKPEKELKVFCTDQLEVFLTKQTESFVDLLFETLRTKSYLQSSTLSLPPPVNTVHALENPVNPAFNGSFSSAITTTATPLVEVFPNVSPVKNERDKIEKKKELSSDLDMSVREARRFPHRSQSSSSSGSSKSHSRERENDERDKRRRGRGSEEERRRRQLPSRRYESRRRSSRNRRPSDSSGRIERSERDRERERDRAIRRERCGAADRQRSRSLTRSRSRSWDHTRSRSHSSSYSSDSRSRSWSRSRERSKEHTCSDARNSRNKGGTPDRQSDHGDTDYRVKDAGVPKSSPSVPRATDLNKKKQSGRVAKRCKDYDEKGYCMRGDLCVYDHGTDPLVVEDVSVLNFGAPAATAPVAPNPGCVLPPNMILQHQHSGAEGESPLPPLPPSSPPPPPPPPPPPLPPSANFAPEPYNPETPGIYRGKRDQVVPSWSPSVPPPQHPAGPSHSIGSQKMPQHTLPSRIVPPFNPNEPPPGFQGNPKLHRTRELIGVPTLASNQVETSTTPPTIEVQDPNISHATTQQAITVQRSQISLTHAHTTVTSVAIPGGSFFRRKQFDYNRLGVKKQLKRNSERCQLELRKIPRHLNTIRLLEKHFSRFGSINYIKINYNGDPEAAVIEFATHAAATAAYRDSEAVLNNRFIKVFWHYDLDSGNTNLPMPSSDATEPSVTNEELTVASNTQQQTQEPVPQPVNFCGSSTITASKQEPFDRAVVFAPKASILRTVFNPAALKKSNVTTSGHRKCKEQGKEAIKKRLEIHKKKRAFLQSNFENQKLLLEKLAKCKNAKEREFLKKTIEDLSEKIFDLQAELKREYEAITVAMKPVKGKYVASKTEAERELLDAEMDLYNKQHKGDDVTDLLHRVNELKHKAMGIIEGRSRGIRGGRLIRGRGGRGRNLSTLLTHTRSVDHRPRKILVMNTADIDKDALKNHFSKFGEIETFESSDAGACVTYKTRKEAEMAFALACKESNPSIPVQNLSVAWCLDSATAELSAKSDLTMSAVGSDKECQENQLLEEEEEEEEEEEDDEDSEARSWRR